MIKVWNGEYNIEMSEQEFNSRLGVDVEVLENPITKGLTYRFSERKVTKKENNRFTKKNIKAKLLRINDEYLEEILEYHECDLDELVSKIYKINYKPSSISNYSLKYIRLANHSNQASYCGDIILANLIFDNK